MKKIHTIAPALFILCAACGKATFSLSESSTPDSDPFVNDFIQQKSDANSAKPGAKDVITPGSLQSESKVAGLPLAAQENRVYRLTNEQMSQALFDLLGVEKVEPEDFGQDTRSLGFTNSASVLSLDRGKAEKIFSAIEASANKASDEFEKITECETPENELNGKEEECIKAFLKEFSEKAHRKVATADYLETVFSEYKADRAELDFKTSFQFLLKRVLHSPMFLFRFEVATQAAQNNNQLKVLAPLKLAEALSFSLLNRIPDDTLVEKLIALEYKSFEEVSGLVGELLEKEEFSNSMSEFINAWFQANSVLDNGRSESEFPQKLRTEMVSEVTDLIKHVWNTDNKVQTLMTSAWTNSGTQLKEHYGIESGAISLNPERRAGLLTRAAVQTATGGDDDTIPTRRGTFVLSNLFCSEVPALPAGVLLGEEDPATRNLSKREAFETHAADPSCKSCHALFDPFGYALENYDSLGKFRTHELEKIAGQDKGFLINSKVEHTYQLEKPVTTNGPVELSKFIADSPRFHKCFVRKTFRYFFGRIETEQDEPLIEKAMNDLKSSDFKMKQMVKTLIASPNFMYRTSTTKTDTQKTEE